MSEVLARKEVLDYLASRGLEARNWKRDDAHLSFDIYKDGCCVGGVTVEIEVPHESD